VTGWKVSIFELMKVGERRINMMRAFNVREGFDRKDDQLPVKFFKPLVGEGPTAGVALDPVEFNNALDLYYQMMGWNENGIPTHGKYSELGLEWITEYL